MYYDYYLLVRRVYGKNYGNTEFLSLYQNLHNFQTPVQGVNFFFSPKIKNIFWISAFQSIYFGVYCITYVKLIISILPLYIYMKKVKKIFVAGGFLRFFIWLSLGPQWTYSKRFWPLTNFLQKKTSYTYIYIWRKTLKEKYL